MVSKLRQDPENGWHHITAHRIEDGNLFEDDDDRWLFLRLMTEAAAKFNVVIVSYALMGNHYHVVLHCPESGVSLFVHHVNGVYARAYNRRHSRTGRLWSDTFYSDLITSDGQLLFTTRYIDRNPLELRFDIRTYPWSSYPAYLDSDALVSFVPIDARVPLGLAGGAMAYQDFVETDNAGDKTSLARGTKRLARPSPPEPTVLLDEVCAIARRAASATTGTDAAKRRRTRAAALLVAHELSLAPCEELRHYFGFSSAGAYASFVYRTRLKADAEPAFFDQVRRLWLARLIDVDQAS